MNLLVLSNKFANLLCMQNNTSVGLSIPKSLLTKIDSERGDVSRSKFLLRLLEKVYGQQESASE